MQVYRAGTRPSQTAPESYFTGQVRMDPVISTASPATVSSLIVTFEPGGRTHWHTHPLGQTIYVLSGCGRAQRDGGPVIELRPGDVVYFEPDERHWHGAGPTTAMTHLAFQEAVRGQAVTWLDPVAEADYLAVPEDTA